MELTQLLTRQVTRTVANRTVRTGAKALPDTVPPVVKRMGVAAVIAGISYLVSKKL